MSDGTPNPATWPMWRGPLAYGHATATRIFGRAAIGLHHRSRLPLARLDCRADRGIRIWLAPRDGRPAPALERAPEQDGEEQRDDGDDRADGSHRDTAAPLSLP